MSIEKFCEMILNHSYKHIWDVDRVVSTIKECTSSEIDKLLPFLTRTDLHEVDRTMNILALAKTDQSRILEAIVPLLKINESWFLSDVFKLIATHGEHAGHIAPQVLRKADALLDAFRENTSWASATEGALSAIGVMPADAKAAMKLARKVNWKYPQTFDPNYFYTIPLAAIDILMRHWAGDPEFAESTVIAIARPNSGILAQKGMRALFILAPHRPALLPAFVSAVGYPPISPHAKFNEKDVKDFLGLMMASSLPAETKMAILLNPQIRLPIYANSGQLIIGYELMKSEDSFQKCRSLIEGALKNNRGETARRGAYYIYYAAKSRPELVALLTESARSCERDLLIDILTYLISLKVEHAEIQSLAKRMADNNWWNESNIMIREKIEEL